MKKLRVAFVAGFMEGFSDHGLRLFATYRKELAVLGQELAFELVAREEPIVSQQQALETRQQWDREGIDFVLLFQPSYIIGDLVFQLMKTDAPFGLWAIEEPSRSGPMPLASFVNLMQNASIASHYFRDQPRKVKWFFGRLDGKYFRPRFEITVRALAAVKQLRDAKVAQIGKIADGHINHYNDWRTIYARLGVDVSRDFEVEDVIARSQQVPPHLVEEELHKLAPRCQVKQISQEKIVDSVKMLLALRAIAEEHDYAAVAFSCWPKLMPLKQMTGCLVNALLNDSGVVAACEGDVLSAVSMLALRALSGRAVTVMDLPAFDESDDSLLLWHCGMAPLEMANGQGVVCSRHYFSHYLSDEAQQDLGPVTEMIFEPGDVTVFRFTGEADRFYYFTGKLFGEEKPSWDGSRGWVHDLKLYGEPIGVMDLMNTILANGVQHHFPFVQRDVGKYLEELAYWLGLKRIERRRYEDFLYV